MITIMNLWALCETCNFLNRRRSFSFSRGTVRIYLCMMGLLINVIGCGLIQECDVGVLLPVVFSNTNQSTVSLIGVTFLVNEFLFVYSYGYTFPPVNCERKGMCVPMKFC
jgi:tetrahydromethanopterin S-methyltransferase subunit D